MLFKVLTWILLSASLPLASADEIRVGSKRFSENYLVAEIVSQVLENEGHRVVRRFGLGGTMVAFKALQEAEIDLYPEYTGTLDEILRLDRPTPDQRNRAVENLELVISPGLGFANSYAIATRPQIAEPLKIKSLRDLQKVPQWRGALSHEFQARQDGWKIIRETYGLEQRIQSLEVPLTYQALLQGQADFIEAYTTEPLLEKENLQLLIDEDHLLPAYEAILLMRQERSELLLKSLQPLFAKLTTAKIRQLNLEVSAGESFAKVAARFLSELQSQAPQKRAVFNPSLRRLLGQTATHLLLTLAAVLGASLLALPLGLACANWSRLATPVLATVGVLQTVPSIALLVFMIPLLGIGVRPALLALIVYALLPILQNTYTGLRSVDPQLLQAARGLGLRPSEIFRRILLPLAFPTILAGIRTATILSLGTATLAAFIGAGGLGEPIVTGLALNDTRLVLQGAVPAAGLAILADRLFHFVLRRFS